ncbi:MAG: hypothetical protein L6Q99_04635 [Planctomycetes bacterium]|nr:hypothetical protein [Planctomycetota bacterium]
MRSSSRRWILRCVVVLVALAQVAAFVPGSPRANGAPGAPGSSGASGAFGASGEFAQARDGCPYCKDDPQWLAASSLESHTPAVIGTGTREEFAAKLVGPRWIFAETAHLRIAFAPGPSTVDQGDRKALDLELDLLRKVLPSVPVKPKKLDPWLRLHLLAFRAERLYSRVQQVLRVTDADFPAQRTADGPYMGNGRFLGEQDKFELVIHATVAQHKRFTSELAGIEVTDALRWHVMPAHKMLASIPAELAEFTSDRWLFPHVAHNLTHLMFCAYKHFSYDPPPWLDEGLALAMEKEIELVAQTYEGEEGTKREGKGPADPWAAAKKRALGGSKVGFAELLNAKNHVELDADRALVAWTLVRFLIDEHGDAFAAFCGDVKGQLGPDGRPTGANLVDLQRDKLRERLGFTPQALDEAWRAWLAARR